ncbi:Multidrug efflux pump subunit AcrB [Chitinophaga costaii]|uniref:Multidrug efflux pump subunit AcrB n=1 Tax=Chitinophaga costaii TaxID=1335309 RepID=A0A1C4F253_9BACT|nr:efflux RND transporter permease subunit [Chitinophaga costaii]PUZ22122.1 AcrB/AcrD/AcrF family protein [Chitinophaga costaii]SCC50068.1 Multidrug efflux pump subunit AcrB [Chitinophaga costaii]
MEKKGQIIEWAMRHHVIPLAIATVLFILGILGLFNMPRNEFPDFTIRQGVIIGMYPGASAEQVEEQLTKKVEEYLFSNNEVDKTKTYSYSRDGMMYIFVEVADRVNGPDTKAFWNKIKNGMLLLQGQLPKEVKGFYVNSDFGSTSALLLAVESPTRNYKELKKNVEDIESELRRVKDVAKISHTGDLNEQISIYVDNNKLLQYGITANTVMQVLQNEGAVSAAGTEKGAVIDRPIHLASFYKTEADLADQIIRRDENGNLVKLRDIAVIKREYEEPDAYITSNGTKSIIISLEMANGKNIVKFGKELEKRLDKVIKHLPPDIKLVKLANQPEVVDESISHFMKEFGFALVGVIIVALLLLPFRIAAVAAATIPITIAATLAIMYLAGIELDTVTLAALIVVLGIVVDDPIVVIDNHVEKLDHGMSVWDAAKSSAIELFPSVFTATLAISATFFPLMFFMSGVAKDFISVFPVTIIIALSLSLAISMVLVPFFNTVFIKKGLQENAEKKKDKKSLLDYLQAFFDKHVGQAMDHYVLTVCFGVLAIVIGVVIMANIPQQLFPKVERNQFAIEINLPSGYNLTQTDSVVKGMERILAKDDRIMNYTSFIGTSSPRFHTLYAPNLPAKNYAQVLVNTTTEKTTEEVISEYQQKYSNIFPTAYVRMKQLNMVNAPAQIEVRIAGNDIATLKDIGNKVSAIGRKHPEVIWVRTDYFEMQEGVRLNVKDQEASRLGLTKKDIANTVAMNMDGLNATQIWEGTYPLDVKIKTPKAARSSTTSLLELNIPSPQTKAIVPLRQVATIEPEWNNGEVVRRNSIRTLTVRMDIKPDAIANQILADIQPEINKIKLPDDMDISYGGELELQNENLGPMGLSLMMSIVLIFLILIWHFKHIKHAVLSITTMPLSILGASFGLLVTGYPFGFTSFLGLLALCGIVVRNGIILIDHAEELRFHEGKTVREAAILSAERRMRPIFLTSSAAAVGVIPMILSRSSLWGPLGTVIAFGLMVSMLLTLFVLPTLYWLFFRNMDKHPAGATEIAKANT